MWNIFESPWLLLAIAALSLVVVQVIRQMYPQKLRYGLLGIPLLLAGAGFAIDFLVRTDYEQIEHIVKECIRGVRDEDVSAFEPLVASNYRDAVHDSREELLTFAEVVLSKPLAEKVRTMYRQVEISGQTATATFKFTVHLEPNSYYSYAPDVVFVKGRLHLRKQGEDWVITGSEVLEINNQPVHWPDIK